MNPKNILLVFITALLFAQIPGVYGQNITAHPTSQTIVEGQPVIFSVTAIGDGTLSYQWQKNGQSIADATSNPYTISHVTKSDAGSYKCLVNNSVTSNPAVLTVQDLISIHPTSQAIVEGKPVTFTVTVAASRNDCTYQWLKDGTSISCAASMSYTIDFVKKTDEGIYKCKVTDNGYNATSNDARLEVTTKLEVLIDTLNKILEKSGDDKSKAIERDLEAYREVLVSGMVLVLVFTDASRAEKSAFVRLIQKYKENNNAIKEALYELQEYERIVNQDLPANIQRWFEIDLSKEHNNDEEHDKILENNKLTLTTVRRLNQKGCNLFEGAQIEEIKKGKTWYIWTSDGQKFPARKDGQKLVVYRKLYKHSVEDRKYLVDALKSDTDLKEVLSQKVNIMETEIRAEALRELKVLPEISDAGVFVPVIAQTAFIELKQPVQDLFRRLSSDKVGMFTDQTTYETAIANIHKESKAILSSSSASNIQQETLIECLGTIASVDPDKIADSLLAAVVNPNNKSFIKEKALSTVAALGDKANFVTSDAIKSITFKATGKDTDLVPNSVVQLSLAQLKDVNSIETVAKQYANQREPESIATVQFLASVLFRMGKIDNSKKVNCKTSIGNIKACILDLNYTELKNCKTYLESLENQLQ